MRQLLGSFSGSINYLSGFFNEWDPNGQETEEKELSKPMFEPERVLKIANVLRVYVKIIEDKFRTFPDETVFPISNIQTLDPKTEKKMISSYNIAMPGSETEKEILLAMYATIHAFSSPDATGSIKR